MKRYLSWSGGKDSSASIVLAYEKGIPLDGVIFSEVMFDHSRNISGENPEHIKWIYEIAIPQIYKMGFPVEVVRAEKDYITLFNTRFVRSKVSSRIGRKWGFPMGGKCFINSQLKISALNRFCKNLGFYESIVGIAIDEEKRLTRLKPNCKSLLVQFGITERATYSICEKYNLLSPIYETDQRGGCWFCPNKSVKAFARLAKQHPELWAELEKLSYDNELITQSFKYGRSFASVNREVFLINNQLSIFDNVTKFT